MIWIILELALCRLRLAAVIAFIALDNLVKALRARKGKTWNLMLGVEEHEGLVLPGSNSYPVSRVGRPDGIWFGVVPNRDNP